jgi:hypothetical protein
MSLYANVKSIMTIINVLHSQPFCPNIKIWALRYIDNQKVNEVRRKMIV